MLLNNSTPNSIFYTIGTNSSADCGSIDPGATADLPYYDNQTNVSVSYYRFGNGQVLPFTIAIPNTGSGKVVTIGFWVE